MWWGNGFGFRGFEPFFFNSFRGFGHGGFGHGGFGHGGFGHFNPYFRHGFGGHKGYHRFW